jgi:hypothetical protein
LQIRLNHTAFALGGEFKGVGGIRRIDLEQGACLDLTVDHFALRGPEARDRRSPRSESLEIQILAGPFELDHEHADLLVAWCNSASSSSARNRGFVLR